MYGKTQAQGISSLPEHAHLYIDTRTLSLKVVRIFSVVALVVVVVIFIEVRQNSRIIVDNRQCHACIESVVKIG